MPERNRIIGEIWNTWNVKYAGFETQHSLQWKKNTHSMHHETCQNITFHDKTHKYLKFDYFTSLCVVDRICWNTTAPRPKATGQSRPGVASGQASLQARRATLQGRRRLRPGVRRCRAGIASGQASILWPALKPLVSPGKASLQARRATLQGRRRFRPGMHVVRHHSCGQATVLWPNMSPQWNGRRCGCPLR